MYCEWLWCVLVVGIAYFLFNADWALKLYQLKCALSLLENNKEVHQFVPNCSCEQVVHIDNRHTISPCFMRSCKSTVVPMQHLLKIWASIFISNKWEIAMASHVTKHANKENNRGAFFICLHLKNFCASILETSHSELRDPKQYDITVWSWSDK